MHFMHHLCPNLMTGYRIAQKNMKQLKDFQYFEVVAKTGSIRKAADKLAITSTALNRRMLSLEQEVGEALFERLTTGVRLSAAGEFFLDYVQKQITDFDRVKSQISDLTGVRRGHINIACSQALLSSFLPRQVSKFRKLHPDVTFSVYLKDRKEAESALLDNSVDLAMVFEPVYMQELQILISQEQRLYAIMDSNHELADKEQVKLSDCAHYPLALPTTGYGVRKLLDFKASRAGIYLEPAVESDSFEYLRNHVINEGCITFQIEIGLPRVLDELGLISRPLSKSDMAAGNMYLVQKSNRTLPAAAARFSQQLIATLTL
jgi:DNA-binding transcriptional LysR family regulator